MRKMPKKILTIAAAAALTLSAFALPACSSFTPLTGDTSGDVSSNGGFVVEKGNYYYFINGVDSYTSDNTYGDVVKASLMRISKTDLGEKNNTAEVVIPSLIVSADYTSGFYIYGSRIYYATPNNVKNTSGETDNSYLSFKSAALDGSDIDSYFSVEDNSSVYRYVEVDDVVYLVYEEDSALHSYNTEANTDVELVGDVGGYVFNSSDKTDPYVYYTMGVTLDIDNADGALDRDYNQVYRVRADATEAPYEYTYDETYLEDNDGEEPYTNLGEIVLDGIGAIYTDTPTQFTHDLSSGITPESSAGYTYTLLSYTNDGIYFTRTDLASTGDTVGETGWLYYIPVSSFGDYLAASKSWNSVSGNDESNFDAIAQTTDYASASAIFYIDGDGHHYLYVDGSNMFRADVTKDGNGKYTLGTASTTLIARGVSDATLVSFDNESDDTYDYVYYTGSGTTGYTVNRAVTNGSEEDYKILNYDDNAPYQPVQILDIEHASGWYNWEIVDGILFYADTQAFSDTSYNYISCVDLTNGDGSLKTNPELEEVNDLYADIMGNDEKDGYLTELEDDDFGNLADAVEYYFYVGTYNLLYRGNDDYDEDDDFENGYLVYEATEFYNNIQDAVDEGKKTTYLYSEEEQTMFREYVEGTGDAEAFVDADGNSYRTRDYFVMQIGQMTEDEQDSFLSYWTTYLQTYSVTEEDSSIPTWGWVLIGVGIGVVVIGVGLAIFFVVRARKKRGADEDEAEEQMFVDTTDDEDIDVYSDETDDSEEANLTEEEFNAAQEAAEEEADKIIQFPDGGSGE